MFIAIVVSLFVGVVAGALLDRKYSKQVGIRIGEVEVWARNKEELAKTIEGRFVGKYAALHKIL